MLFSPVGNILRSGNFNEPSFKPIISHKESQKKVP